MTNTNYTLVARQLAALVEGVPYEVANLANASALLWQEMPDINSQGFYKMVSGKLVLGRAEYANVKNLLESFENNLDIHTETAKKVFKVEEITPEMRRMGSEGGI